MQALEVIHELQKHFPIKRSPMRLRLTIPEQGLSSLMEKLNEWNAKVVSKDQSGSQHSIVCLTIQYYLYAIVRRFLPPEIVVKFLGCCYENISIVQPGNKNSRLHILGLVPLCSSVPLDWRENWERDGYRLNSFS